MNSFSQVDGASSKKQVDFAEYSSLIITRPKTRKDLKSSWHTKYEMKSFRFNARMDAREMRKEHPAATKEYISNSFDVDFGNVDISGVENIENICGIEHLLDEQVYSMLNVCRSLTVKRVLEEQKRQERTGEKDVHLLAQASVQSSALSVVWRHRIARMNSTDVDL